MRDIIYAVHTRTCTFLLDEEGVCRWIVSQTGAVPPDVRRCVGAQFVACLDTRIAGGLAGELVLGGSALFVAAAEDGSGRLSLLRTGAIQHVEFRDPNEPLPQAPPPRQKVPPLPLPLPTREETKTLPPPAMLDDDIEAEFDPEITSELDPDDLVIYAGDEATVTLTLPLFRPGAQPPIPSNLRRGR